jgi:hypothetical protein
MFRGFRNQWPSRTIGPMASRDRIIAAAAEVVLDRRVRGDDAKVAAARQRVGGSEVDQAAAEFWCLALVGVAEERDNAGLDGRHALRSILASKRHLAAVLR